MLAQTFFNDAAVMCKASLAKLYCVQGDRYQDVEEVQLRRESLTQHEAFILDNVSKIYIWCGCQAPAFERCIASAFAESKASERGHDRAKVILTIDDDFWKLLDGRREVVEGPTMEMAAVLVPLEAKLYLVSEEGHESYLKGFLKEMPVTRDSLNQHDVFVLDSGWKIYVWIGDHAPPFQAINANLYADQKESKRGSDPAVMTHDVDDKFWKLLGGNGPIRESRFTPYPALPSAAPDLVEWPVRRESFEVTPHHRVRIESFEVINPEPSPQQESPNERWQDVAECSMASIAAI